jgi:hypothetical protein
MNFIKSIWTNQIAPYLRLLFFFFLWALVILLILAVFKYVFLTSCINIGNVRECVSSVVDSSGTLFAVGSILVAIVVLIPTFWTESKMRDAKKEISREILENITEKMQDLNKAQILIFEADRYQSTPDLINKELLIEEAIRLWPLFKQEEHRKLGNDFSLAVMSEFYSGLSRGMSITAYQQGTSLQRGQIGLYLSKAIFYLEETVQNSETAGREELVNLACMYGCAVRYEDMIRTIERAIKVDENARDDFQEAKRLSLLVYACGSNRHLIEKLGKKVGKDLPLSKAEFVSIISKVDLQSRRGRFIEFFAVRRQRSSSTDYVYIIKIGADEEQGQRLVNGSYLTVIKGNDKHDVTSIDEEVTIEEFYNRVDKELFIVCFSEE